MYGHSNPAEAGEVLFLVCVGFQLVATTLLAPAFTAGAITGEHQNKTFDLLRTTLLPARSIVSGKLVSALTFLLMMELTSLPVISVGFDIALSPKWFVRQQLDMFYLEISDYKGGIADIQLALEYLPWKNFGFGLGLDSLTVKVEAEDSGVPGVDFQGDIGFDTTGVQLYVKAFF